MFSFHKPKIYRSNLGCCICKAKSSSSRFTDSQKYENEFERCFRIQEKRSGEICNACVLLVKRWKKLSPENRLTKHWHHVVDARAGPGTKLSGNRRILSHQSHQSSSKAHHKSATAAAAAASNTGSNRSEVLPLSSSQANQQTSSSSPGSSGGSGGKGRSSSFSKARAIDTNVSTFTFGEPPASAYRRNYMTGESASYSAFSSLAPLNSSSNQSQLSGLTKPQSALNSSAFESVIKRFRQRQQQQHLEQQRRQMSRQQRQLERQQRRQQQQQTSSAAQGKSTSAATTTTTTITTTTNSDLSGNHDNNDQHDDNKPVSSDDNNKQTITTNEPAGGSAQPTQSKRVKRLSESYGSLASLESLKVASVLDASIWRREKICCGIIFRGLFNEVAIFPKLLKPCECRLQRPASQAAEETSDDKQQQQPADEEEKDALSESPPPPPRAVKSGSVSSSTSGTGSMEQTVEEIQAAAATAKPEQASRGLPTPTGGAKRLRSVPSKRRRQQSRRTELDVSGSSELSYQSSKESTSADSPGSGTSSSGGSSSRMILMIDGEHELEADEDQDDEDELVLADNDALESSNDASSSAESLLEMEDKNSSALAMG